MAKSWLQMREVGLLACGISPRSGFFLGIGKGTFSPGSLGDGFTIGCAALHLCAAGSRPDT